MTGGLSTLSFLAAEDIHAQPNPDTQQQRSCGPVLEQLDICNFH